MIYNWQHIEWPNFQYDKLAIKEFVPVFQERINEMDSVLHSLNTTQQQEEIIRFMISEAATTSEIEGEFISREDLMSSIKNNLGLTTSPKIIKDKRAIAITNLLAAVQNSYNKPLTETDIKQWHSLLFENSKTVKAGTWRSSEEPMQVVSGTFGKEIVHFEAPPSYRVDAEMKKFILWYNTFNINEKGVDTLIKTAVAHLYFESIHPFEDGNGRMGRAIAEKCLAQSLGKPVLLSLSTIIEKNRKQYYAALKEAQHSLEITKWIEYFTSVITQAQIEAIETVRFSLFKTKFFDKYKDDFNPRELKTIKKMFDTDITGFEGGMTAKKYMSINKTSKATATRDLQHLTKIGALLPKSGGRNIYYELNLSF